MLITISCALSGHIPPDLVVALLVDCTITASVAPHPLRMLLRRATKWAAVGLTARQVQEAYRNKTRSRPGQEAKEKRPEPSTTDRTKPASGWETAGQYPAHGSRSRGRDAGHVHVSQTGDGRTGKARVCLPRHPCTETTHSPRVDGTRRLWALDWVLTKKGLLQYLGLTPRSHSGGGETEDAADPQEPGAEPDTATDRHRSRRSRRGRRPTGQAR